MSTAEIPMDEAELLALMEELEMETGVKAAAVKPPVTAPKIEETPVTAPLIDEDEELLAELESLEETPAPKPAPKEPEPFIDEEVEIPAATRKEASKIDELAATLDADEELAAIEAQLESELASEPAPVATPAPKLEPKVVASEPKPANEAGPKRTPLPEPEVASYSGGLKFYVDANEFTISTKISDVDLDQCLIEQNSLRAFYGAQAAHAEAQHARSKASFEVLEARLYDEHRRIIAESGEKATEKMVENAVRLDARWLAGKNRVIESETIANVNRALVMSLVDRRDMLIQLGADRRDEMKGQARVLAAADARLSESERAIAAAKAALQK